MVKSKAKSSHEEILDEEWSKLIEKAYSSGSTKGNHYYTNFRTPGREEIENQGQASYYDLRKNWSWGVLVALFVMIGYQIWLTHNIFILIIEGILKFEEVSKLFYVLAGENFAQIVGAAVLVVNFLFPSTSESKK